MFEIEKVSTNVWAHVKGETRGNVAFIKVKDYVVAVDSGMDPLTSKVAKKQAEQELGVPIEKIIITHHHPDHVFGIQTFEDCEIISAEKVAKIMKKQIEGPWSKKELEKYINEVPEYKEKWKDLKIIPPTTIFENNFEIREGEIKIDVIETNGHTSGSSFIHVLPDNVIITGDLLFAETFPYAGDPTSDPYLWEKALEKMIELEPVKVVPGHGPVTSTKELMLHRDYLRKLIKRMEDSIVEGAEKEKIFDSCDLIDFPYSVDENRKKALYEQFYSVIKKAIESY
ncbi:MAG: MBL fold metallo-hydrolase [Candidatus Heimdallarchaeaceae archaeon]